MIDLATLRDAVADGTATAAMFDIAPLKRRFGGQENVIDAHRAYLADLTGAEALHEHVLCEWTWSLESEGLAFVESPEKIMMVGDLRYAPIGLPRHPARAWLLAILNALIYEDHPNG